MLSIQLFLPDLLEKIAVKGCWRVVNRIPVVVPGRDEFWDSSRCVFCLQLHIHGHNHDVMIMKEQIKIFSLH